MSAIVLQRCDVQPVGCCAQDRARPIEWAMQIECHAMLCRGSCWRASLSCSICTATGTADVLRLIRSIRRVRHIT